MKKVVILLVLVLVLVTGCKDLGIVAKLPSINTFGASPSPISPGGSATLTWNVSDATTVAISQGIGNVALTGSRTVSPSATMVYTLTATNAAGSVTATAEVAVTAAFGTPPPSPTPTPPIPEPTPFPPSMGLPEVNYFNASPFFISAGGTVTLSWGVTNATTVSIDQGIGNVGLVGTAPASPPVTTNYTLTATNAVGWRSITITVGVGAPPPPADKPDLIVTDILFSGSTISYIIKNQGTATAGPSTTRLVIDGVVKATDAVGPLSAGASSNESFSYSYSCSGTSDSVAIQVDINDVVAESNEGNNARSESRTCLMVIDPGIILTLKPDLIITDIYRVDNKIWYKIKNQGTFTSPATTTRLSVDGGTDATDAVGSLAAGAESTQVFSTYNLPFILFHIYSVAVYADYTNAATESNEGNNARMESISY